MLPLRVTLSGTNAPTKDTFPTRRVSRANRFHSLSPSLGAICDLTRTPIDTLREPVRASSLVAQFCRFSHIVLKVVCVFLALTAPRQLPARPHMCTYVCAVAPAEQRCELSSGPWGLCTYVPGRTYQPTLNLILQDFL